MPFALRQIVSAALLCIVCTALIAAEHFHYGRFGTVAIYRPGDGDVRSVALLLSGDGGRDAGTVALAKRLAGLNTLVIGIDTRAYLQRLEGSAEACAQPWAELRSLAQAVERREGVSGYIWPMLVGQSSGASLAYAALVQAPTDTFKGGVAVEFCPELRMAKPLCKGDQPSAHPGLDRKGLVLDPVMQLNAPFSVLAGESTGTCDGARAKAFFAGMIGATSIPVGATERDSDGGNAWQGQFQEAYLRIAGSDASMRTSAVDEPAGLADLPLTEVVDKSARATDTFAIFFSGDGGWATLDAETSKRLAAAGVPVVGVSSLRYFWRERSPRRWRATSSGSSRSTASAGTGRALRCWAIRWAPTWHRSWRATWIIRPRATWRCWACWRQVVRPHSSFTSPTGSARPARAGRSSRKWRPSGRCPWFACMAPTRRAKACVACPRWRATRFVPSRAVITSRATTMASLPRCSPAWD